ncbi:acyl-CoA dehydrogenase C-terminal domain-containing protein [Roseomonas marmotae]|uniref:Acyl-CoA dehydrogenase C-terminal domain-containing protein n=1 Tax=Roseomonas marmotae TaxID=2768161 RepID=A0ABS3KIL7_9PROT|nr:acyl-CoA dehydrogenase C-terminal domain-containing protein [Roseomonas marmotae]MBO1076161.1 acyl-CoA dehydrogenase C-terminal domain-containing protein [Roseomonas marmotae]QTI81802.1 acyl-CoA dehydrogenase C-terminal domain-containing protein [Roseomonas marmotae]
MPAYAAPVDDMLFVLGDLLDAPATLAGLGGEEVSLSLMGEVLGEAGRFCEKVAQPINRSGDEEGCVLENGAVRTPKGFPEAYAAFVEGGWPGLAHAPEHGGQGLPRVLQVLFDEMLSSANFSFGLFPGLTRGAVEAIERHGDATLKETYLPPMVEGRWMGAMALTEAHAGTDLGLLRSKAEPQADGSHRVTGSKIFISAGDHDLSENIIHLVLARLPDAPPGVKGISLFLVPKFLPGEAGGLGARNAMSVGSIEHKMGIKASPTCVMNYDGATGWLVGAPHQGLRAMFTMMNAERLFVGIQGLGIAEAAYQGASAYARERVQGRAPGAASGPAQPILVHPDVRKMLLTIRGFSEAGRALAAWTALEMEKAARHPDIAARARAEGMVALLTPVIKAAFTDLGFESAVLAQQVFGGHGYVREWGMEQLVRDARIAQIYEGTNGIQAMDLVGRKLTQDGGALPRAFFAEIRESLAPHAASEFAAPVLAALERLEVATEALAGRAAADPAEPGAAATDYLRFFALVALGWIWARMALLPSAPPAKQAVARFFMARILPQTLGLELALRAGAAPVMALEDAAF